MSEFEIVKSEYNALDEQGNYKTHYFKTSADQVVGLGRMKNTEYQVSDVVYSDTNNKVTLKCVTAGTTSNAELDISSVEVGSSVTDGSVVWEVVKRYEDVHKLADYPLRNIEYALNDVVACPYHVEFLLKCTQAGRTSTEALDTTNVTAGQVITDGGAKWKVIAKAIVDASISGKVITLTFADGTTKTLTTQDTNTNNISASSSGASGYTQLSNGMRIQYGRVTTSSDTYATFTFPKAFSNKDYSVTAAPISAGDAQYACAVHTKTTTSVRIYGNNMTMDVIAIGY